MLVVVETDDDHRALAIVLFDPGDESGARAELDRALERHVTTGPAAGDLTALVGVYDADGGLVGESRYVVGNLLGRVHCTLCDITHGGIRRKRSFDELRDRLGVPFEVVHRNERSPQIAAVTDHALPAVVAVSAAGAVVVLDGDGLAACEGQVDRFEDALRLALASRGFELPAA